jgi:hypothetical protein
MTEDAKRNDRLEVCQSVREASVGAQISRQLKSLFSAVLNEPLPCSFLRALQSIQGHGSTHEPDPQSDGGDLHECEEAEQRLVVSRRNAA